MKAIAIDDEPIALEIIRSHAAKVPFLQLDAVFTDAFQALDYMQNHETDLLFLDIKMPDISGIEFFNSLTRKPLLVFTTAYSEHAVTSFEMDAIDYLLKPFSLTRFIKACSKAHELYMARREAGKTDHIFIKTGYEQVKVFFSEILYVEGAGNYVNFVLHNKKVMSRSTFAEVESLLPQSNFVRVHRSFIVATDKIEKVEKNQVVLKEHSIPLGDTYSRNLAAVLK